MSAIKIDPKTGLKVFNTRAAQAPRTTQGSGYAVVQDESLKVLPATPVGAVFDAEEQARYRDYKEARRDVADYVLGDETYETYLADPYSVEVVERAALTDGCDVIIVGAGFAGLLLWHKLRAAGFDDVRICEKGGDVGGTWYWNRYPGVACDVESYSYLPLLEEMDYFPTMKFASGFEIFEYCQSMAERFKLYDKCLFHTNVDRLEWEEETERWTVHTNRGDRMTARVAVMANGVLTTPKLARIDGMEAFEGESFHTSRWNYDVDLRGKRVGVIGTGATAVQVIPEIAKVVEHLYVFQRTPSTIDVRDQQATDPAQIEAWKAHPGWAKERRERFARIRDGRMAVQADEKYLSGELTDYRIKKQHARPITAEELTQKQLDANFRLMEQIRARVDAIVHDPKTAAALKPWYTYGCKRPCFHDEYLPTFNRPNVTLVDTAPSGVTCIDPAGVVFDGKSYPLDILVYATGFDWMSPSAFDMVLGRGGQALSKRWAAEGTRTFLGVHSHGFPNLFVVTGPQGGGGEFNFTLAIEGHTDYITSMLTTMRERGAATVDVSRESEEAWNEHCVTVDLATAPLRNCSSYYNKEGHAEPGSLGYYGGDQWYGFARKSLETLAAYEFGSARSIAESENALS